MRVLALCRACQRGGDGADWGRLVAELRPTIRGALWAADGAVSLDDGEQEAWVRLLPLPAVEATEDGQLRAYVGRVARSVAVDCRRHVRALRRGGGIEARSLEETPSAAAVVDGERALVARVAAREALQVVRERRGPRAAAMLGAAAAGWDAESIAERVDIRPSSIYSEARRSRRELASWLADE